MTSAGPDVYCVFGVPGVAEKANAFPYSAPEFFTFLESSGMNLVSPPYSQAMLARQKDLSTWILPIIEGAAGASFSALIGASIQYLKTKKQDVASRSVRLLLRQVKPDGSRESFMFEGSAEEVVQALDDLRDKADG